MLASKGLKSDHFVPEMGDKGGFGSKILLFLDFER
jgi:hypothetical protein